jgi:hypothetical protein
MPVNVNRLTIEDLKMLLCIQHEKVAREAEVKRLAEEVECEAEQVVAAAAAQKAEEEAKEKARRGKKARRWWGAAVTWSPALCKSRGRGRQGWRAWSPWRNLGMRARGKLFVFCLFCALLLTAGRCCNNKIACVWGSIRGKAAACVKAKQRCRVFGGEEEWPVVESTVLGKVTTILRDIIEVLRGICMGMRALEEAFDGHWCQWGVRRRRAMRKEGSQSWTRS